MIAFRTALISLCCVAAVAAVGCGSTSGPLDDGTVQDAADVSDVIDVSDLSDLSDLSGVSDASDVSDAAIDIPPETVDTIESVEPVRFMSFNLRMPYDSDPGKRWDDRKSVLVSIVKDFQPDVMVTQEGYLDPLAFIKDNVDDFAWIGDARNNTPLFDEHCAIFYRTDKLELIETKTVAISDTPDVPGSRVDDEDQLYARIITWGHFKRIADSFEFDVFSTHWDHTGVDGIRQKMAVITLGQMAALGGDRPAFVAGDFNCGFNSEPYKIMTGQMTYEGTTGALTDTWVELGLQEEGSFHGFTGVASGDRIDWILHNDGFEAVSASIIKTSVEGVYPSDHFPIGAEFLPVRP